MTSTTKKDNVRKTDNLECDLVKKLSQKAFLQKQCLSGDLKMIKNSVSEKEKQCSRQKENNRLQIYFRKYISK